MAACFQIKLVKNKNKSIANYSTTFDIKTLFTDDNWKSSNTSPNSQGVNIIDDIATKILN